MPDVLQVTEEAAGGAHLIATAGEIDHATSRLVADALRRATEAGDGHVVLDLTAVSFIDSAGTSAPPNGLRRLTRHRPRRIAVCPPGRPRRGFELLRVGG